MLDPLRRKCKDFSFILYREETPIVQPKNLKPQLKSVARSPVKKIL